MKQRSWYKIIYSLLRPIGWLAFPQKTIGRENIPSAPFMVCAPHSNLTDPILISFALGVNHYIHHLSKKELESVPVVGWALHKIGSIFVQRGEKDIDSFRKCISVLKAGENLLIFPEGTRAEADNTIEPKTGPVRIASKLHVPILPVYVPRNKKPFKRYTIVIGEPFYVEPCGHEELAEKSIELMDKILKLKGKI